MTVQKKEFALTPEESALLVKIREALALGIDVKALIEEVKQHSERLHNNDTEE